MSVASGSDPGSNVPYVARQLRNAARKDIAMIRARFDNDREAAPSKKWAALDDLIKKEALCPIRAWHSNPLYRSRYYSGWATEHLIDDVHRLYHLLASDIVPFLAPLSLDTGFEIECCKALMIDCLRNPAGKPVEISYMKREREVPSVSTCASEMKDRSHEEA